MAMRADGMTRVGLGLARIHRLTLMRDGLPEEQMPSYLGR